MKAGHYHAFHFAHFHFQLKAALENFEFFGKHLVDALEGDAVKVLAGEVGCGGGGRLGIILIFINGIVNCEELVVNLGVGGPGRGSFRFCRF